MQRDWEAIGSSDSVDDQKKSSYGELFISLRDVHRQPFAIDILRLNCGQFTRSAANIQRLDTLLTSAKHWTTLQARVQFDHFQKREAERIMVAKQKVAEKLALLKKSLTERKLGGWKKKRGKQSQEVTLQRSQYQQSLVLFPNIPLPKPHETLEEYTQRCVGVFKS